MVSQETNVMNYDVYSESNANALSPDVVDALMPHAGAMLDVKRVLEETPRISKDFKSSLEYRKIKACCPHRHIYITPDTHVTLLKQADTIMKDGTVRCALCGAPILTKWDKDEFAKKLNEAVAVIDTILLYGPNFNLGNWPRGYTGDQGILDKMIMVKEFLSVNMQKISETFCSVSKAENSNQENARSLGRNYHDRTSNVTSWY